MQYWYLVSLLIHGTNIFTKKKCCNPAINTKYFITKTCWSVPVRTFFMLMLRLLLWLSTSSSSVHRVFISNLQKEIEKQTGYRSSRKRRSASQYDYEVYHSLEEVDVKSTIYSPLSLTLLCLLI